MKTANTKTANIKTNAKTKPMAKMLLLFLSLVLLLTALTACGSEGGSGTSGSAPADALTLDGTVIKLGDDFGTVKKLLGEASDVKESKSCHYNGMDKTFTYDGITFVTYPDGETDRVSSFSIKQSSAGGHTYTAGCGIKPGDSAASVEEKYGKDKLKMNSICYIYEEGSYGIAFYLDNTNISEVEVYQLVN